MLRDLPLKHEHELLVDGVKLNFLLARKGARVAMHPFTIPICLTLANSWETMVSSRTREASAVQETFFPTFRRRG